MPLRAIHFRDKAKLGDFKMVWGKTIRGLIGSIIVGTALILGLALPAKAGDLGLALPAKAGDNEISLSATTIFTTDYVSRGISQTRGGPAAQAELDLSYGIFYAGVWGSNVDFGSSSSGQDIANIEIDYYAGITPEWQGISFDIGGLYYTYPGAFDPGGNFDYFEVKTGASYTFGESFTAGITNYYAWEFFGQTGEADTLELSGEYAFGGQLFNIFTPSVSGMVGWQWTKGTDYTYWNAGLTLGFMDNWAVDVRYWDTDFSSVGCAGNNCDSRVVGTVTASF